MGKTVGCILLGELSTAKCRNRCVSALFIIPEVRAAVLELCAKDALRAASARGDLESGSQNSIFSGTSLDKGTEYHSELELIQILEVSKICIRIYAKLGTATVALIYIRTTSLESSIVKI